VAAAVGLPPAEGTLPRLGLPAGREESASIDRRFPGASRSVAIHPGSGSPKKNWPRERFAELSSLLEPQGLATIWVLGPAEMERPELAELAVRAGPPSGCLSDASLVEVAALLSRVRVYVGNDSGVTHLAAALGTPTVALFGPSEAAVWGPRAANVEVLSAPRGDLSALEAAQVLGAVRRVLGRRGWA
jgi:heptosyltransferase-2